MDYAFDYVKKAGGVRISIAVIHENEILKQWYLDNPKPTNGEMGE
jgi:hypothetical protein